MRKNHKGRLKPILIMIITILVLTSFRLLWLKAFQEQSQSIPLAQNGVLDLRDFEWSDGKTVTLDGEWEFFSETLVDPNAVEEDLIGVSREIVSVPTKSNDDLSVQYGTYRLQILLDEDQIQADKAGITIQSAETASALFINGELGGNSGQVGINQQQHIGEDFPYEVVFTPDQSIVNVYMHVSNFDTLTGVQIGKSIEMVSFSPHIHQHDYEGLLVYGMVAMLVLHSLYTIFIYIFIYRKKIVLFFTIGFLLPAIDELLTYDKSILAFLQLDYDGALKFTTMIYLGASFFYVQLMRVLLTNHRQSKVFQWYLFLYALSAILIVVLPIEYLPSANKLFFLLYMASFFSVVIFALKEALYNEKESFYLALAALSTTSGILWGGIKSIGMYTIPFYPFDYVFALLAFAGYWFHRYYEKEKKLVRVVKELEMADRLKDEFLDSNSQKLWTPLNEMMTIAETMYKVNHQTKSLDKSDLKSLMDIGNSMSFALSNLLAYTKLKEGMVVVKPIRVDVKPTVQVVIDMLSYMTEGKKIEVKSSIAEDFPDIYADENRFIQILFNVLHNATKYTNEGMIEIKAREKDGMASISIVDTGIGMGDVSGVQNVRPYRQENQYDEGIGLGLNVCQKLIELQGGTLTLQSWENQGTEVQMTFPLATEQASPVSSIEEEHSGALTEIDQINEERAAKSSKNKPYNILVVDDDPVNVKIISSILLSENYHVISVTTAKEALNLVDTKEWDLLIVDAMMPYMSGYELTRIIRKRYPVLELPIILLTARNYLENVDIGFDIGVNDYINKPINAAKLKSRVRTLVQLKFSMDMGLYMEAAWLQARIQPHFMYNTLNTIASLGMTDTTRMTELIHKLTDYLRASFDMKNLAHIAPIEQELHLVRTYLYIEKERFKDRLNIEWEIADELTVGIPPLSIQPLVENAIHHGILKKQAGGTIVIRVTEHPNFIKITVKDDGVGMDKERVAQLFDEDSTGSGGVGLFNTNKRLERIYGTGLIVSSEQDQGTEISFSVPQKQAD